MKLSDCFDSIVLGSQSIARKAVLESQGLKVQVFVTHADESHTDNDGGSIVKTLAQRKLDSTLKSIRTDLPVLCCDTLVYLDGSLIGKAHSQEEAFKMLKSFSGKTQVVYSGYALCYRGKVVSGYDEAKVLFKELKDQEIMDYIKTGEYIGAAGAYRIQGLAKAFIASITGDINTVIGLPLKAIEERLDYQGFFHY